MGIKSDTVYIAFRFMQPLYVEKKKKKNIIWILFQSINNVGFIPVLFIIYSHFLSERVRGIFVPTQIPTPRGLKDTTQSWWLWVSLLPRH